MRYPGQDQDPVWAARALCERIEQLDGPVRSFLPEADRTGRLAAAAKAVAEGPPGESGAPPRPPLFGIPVAVKDIIRVDGLPTRAGSVLPPEEFAGPQAAAVTRLRAAGALIAGKTTTAEFAMAAPADTRNPHNPAHTPGGSSSGSAAAVAAGLVPLALGTQTVGSVIRPAAYCGVVGYIPTFGRIPVDGVIPNVPSFDRVGVLADTPATAELAASVLCDYWRPPAGDVPAPVLGIPEGPFLAGASAVARAAFAATVAALEAAGITVRRIPALPDIAEIRDWSRLINRYEAAQVHATWFVRYGALYREPSARTVREGRSVQTDDYQRALTAREDFRTRLLAAMDAAAIDAWATPAATGPAPYGLDRTGDPAMCLPWSSAGLPAVALPTGRAPGNLPLGLQLIARPDADEALLAQAELLAALLPPDRFDGMSTPESDRG